MTTEGFVDWTVFAVLAIGAIAVWTLIVLRVRKGRPVLEHEPRRPVPWQGVDLAVVLLVYLIVISIVFIELQHLGFIRPLQATAASKLSVTAEERTVHIAADAAIKLVAAAVGLAWIAFRVRATAVDFGVGISKIGSDVLIGAAAFFGSVLPVMLLEDLLQLFIPYSHEVIKALQFSHDAKTLLITGIAAIIAAPIAEEFFFRVLIQGCLEAVEFKRRMILIRQHVGGRSAACAAQSQADSPAGSEAGSATRPRTTPAPPPPTEEQLALASGPAAWPIIVSSAL
ncbi:MAG TPA: hypothetical protein VKB78_16360, partial [Pirellulales bacterium]|nr:hypothetical protein [Pirellulales bacterium]